jgi:hypothetical protein
MKIILLQTYPLQDLALGRNCLGNGTGVERGRYLTPRFDHPLSTPIFSTAWSARCEHAACHLTHNAVQITWIARFYRLVSRWRFRSRHEAIYYDLGESACRDNGCLDRA